MESQNIRPKRAEQNTVCFTGHRMIPEAEIPLVRQRLRKAVRECLDSGYRWFMCGGALGFDTMAAEAVLAAKEENPETHLYLAVPCAEQADRWSGPDRARYREIMDRADEVHVLSPKYYSGCMQVRNQYMVRHSALCICWLRRFEGGTGYTVRYALRNGRQVVNLCLPEASGIVKEPSWNYTFTFPSASGNAPTAPSIPLRALEGRTWKPISPRSCGKLRHGRNT